jgi:hypothetical protein
MFHLLIKSVVPEFDHYLAIYTFSNLQEQFQSQDDWNQVLMVKLYVPLPAYHR